MSSCTPDSLLILIRARMANAEIPRHYCPIVLTCARHGSEVKNVRETVFTDLSILKYLN